MERISNRDQAKQNDPDVPNKEIASDQIPAVFFLTMLKTSLNRTIVYNLTHTKQPLSFGRLDVPNVCFDRGPLDKQVPCASLLSHSLTPREKEVLLWAARGKTSWEIGMLLNLTEKTVKFYLANARKKLKVQNTTHAVAICLSERTFEL